jgi:hypothetical protein
MTEFLLENKTKIFPSVLILLEVIASAVYLHDGDWRKSIYWLSAAILTTTVTY